MSEQANGRASGPVFMSQFLFVPDHSALLCPNVTTLNEELYRVSSFLSIISTRLLLRLVVMFLNSLFVCFFLIVIVIFFVIYKYKR